ncbi:GNAT family N-acetyltransferase [Spirosoma horti]
MVISFQINSVPTLTDIIDLFDHSGYYPLVDKGDTDRLKLMHERANLLVTAWDDTKLVGIARSLTDFCYCCYLSDLAVRDDYKGKGIGETLVNLTKEHAGERCKLILHSSPEAAGFYAKIGMEPITTAFIIRRTN